MKKKIFYFEWGICLYKVSIMEVEIEFERRVTIGLYQQYNDIYPPKRNEIAFHMRMRFSMEYCYMDDKIYVEFDFKLSTKRLFRILMFFSHFCLLIWLSDFFIVFIIERLI